jgi:heptosyltransferase-1
MDRLKFLILRLSAVGDVIRTLPAVKALKEYYPTSSITWITEESSRTLLESQPEIDEVILFPRKRWTDGMKSMRRMWRTGGEVYGFIFGLRRRRFDVVLDFHGILKSGFLSFFSGAPKRIGFDRRSSKEGNFLFSNIKVRLPKERISRFQKNFVLLRGIGLEVNPVRNANGSLNPAGIIVKSTSAAEQRGIISNGVNHFSPKLHIPEEDKDYIESFFNTLSMPIKRPFVAIHPGTSQKTIYKRWMANQYSQLSDRLIRELNATVIFTWGPGELRWVEGIRKQMKEPSILGPQTESLTKLGEIFRRCNLYIGSDTGPMHIASFMGIPVVVIYGPTDPIVNEPFGRHKKVRKEVGCNPCRKRSCKELTCLKSIQVDDVFKATKEILCVTT